MKKRNSKCHLCNTKERYSHLKIAEGRFWRIELRDLQCYLGWSLVILKRHLEDLCDVEDEEWRELHEIMTKLRNSIRAAWKPNRINYGSLGNKDNHVHIQVVPRYKRPVQFNGIIFKDKRWGSNYGLYVNDVNPYTSKTMQKVIIEKIKAKL